MGIEQKQKKLIWFILFVLIALQLGRIVYVFAHDREGFHSDENWSYGYANSYYTPHIFADENGRLKNFNKWTSSQVMRDYLEVNIGEEFSYGSVYFNQEKDLSPPLYSMLLHTICSFFPETFSWYYAFFINIVVFILTQILLYFLCFTMTKSRWVGLITCFFYGFTIGALNCFIYLRMYALLTLLTILLTYLHSRMYSKHFQGISRESILTALTVIVGALTHYYFLIFSFFMATCFCLYLLFIKRWKAVWVYTAFMLFAVMTVFAIYPFAISHILGGPTLYGNKLSYIVNFKYCLSILLGEISGITLLYPDRYTLAIFLCVLASLVAIIGPLCFLFRREIWFLKFLHVIKIFLVKVYTFIAIIFKKMQWVTFFVFLSVIASLAVIAQISNILAMNVLADRYLFFLMPLFCIVLVSFCYFIVESIPMKLFYRRGILVLILIIVLAVNNISQGSTYLFKRNSENASIEQITKGADCIIVTDSAWRLTYYASRLLDTDQFFTMLDKECMLHEKELSKLMSSKPLYILIETGKFPDENGKLQAYKSSIFEDVEGLGLDYTLQTFLDYLLKLDWVSHVTYVTSEDSFVGQLAVYRIGRK